MKLFVKIIAILSLLALVYGGSDTTEEAARRKLKADKVNHVIRKLKKEVRSLQESSGIYNIIHGAVDFAEQVTMLCTSTAVEDAAVREFCDEAY